MNNPGRDSLIIQTVGLTIWLGLFGTQIEIKPMIDKFKAPKGILLGLVLQTIFLPAWTSILITLCNSSGYVAIAFLVVACSPGGTTSNFWCLITKSDLALSAAMTTFSTFVCAGMMPLNLYIWGRFIDYSTNYIPIELVLAPAFSIIIGTGTGMWLRHKMSWTRRTLKRIANVAMISGLIMCVLALVKIYTDRSPTVNFGVGDYFMAFLMNGTTLFFGAWIARLIGLTKPEAVSVGYEVSTQNLSIPLFIFYNSQSEEETANMTTVLMLFGVASLILNLIYYCIMVKLRWTNHAKDLDLNEKPSCVLRALNGISHLYHNIKREGETCEASSASSGMDDP